MSAVSQPGRGRLTLQVGCDLGPHSRVAVDVLLLVPFLHEQLEKGALRSHRVGVDAVVVGAHFARLKPARLTGTDWHRGHPDRRLGRGL